MIMNINRNYYLNKIIRHKHNDFIKIMSGIRRCGKSYMLFELFKNHLISQGVPDTHIIKIQLDNRKHKKYQNPDACYNYVESQIKDENIIKTPRKNINIIIAILLVVKIFVFSIGIKHHLCNINEE